MQLQDHRQPAWLDARRFRVFAALGFGVCLVSSSIAAAGSGATGYSNRFDAVIIDAGHGGKDEGAKGRRGLLEKDLVLDVSKRLARRLRKQGLEVHLTRSDDTFVPLEERTARANDARGDLFISIHANSSHSDRPRGIETYFVSLEASDATARRVAEIENQALGRGGAASVAADPFVALLGDMIATDHMEDSSAFAKLAQAELRDVGKVPSRGVKQAPFVVLMGVQMPAALIEIGFMSNSRDVGELLTDAYRDQITEALARAVFTFQKRYDARRGIAVGY
jgi:N-acetylmuramoyl-L-alanine amidase